MSVDDLLYAPIGPFGEDDIDDVIDDLDAPEDDLVVFMVVDILWQAIGEETEWPIE